MPEWFLQGMDAVHLAPTARNLRPFVFKYKDGQVTASITIPTETAIIDLGIAKFHFELGARVGSWDYGNGGHYYFEPVGLAVHAPAQPGPLGRLLDPAGVDLCDRAGEQAGGLHQLGSHNPTRK